MPLGDERLGAETFEQLPAGEQELIRRFRTSFGSRFWEHYRQLRGMKYRPDQAMVGAWLAVGAAGRGPFRTRLALAEALGKSRHTVYRIAERMEQAAQALRVSWLADRVPDVDEAVYQRAVSVLGQAADRKLFYQRAGVQLEQDPDTGRVDNWLVLIEQARQEAQGGGGAEG